MITLPIILVAIGCFCFSLFAVSSFGELFAFSFSMLALLVCLYFAESVMFPYILAGFIGFTNGGGIAIVRERKKSRENTTS